MKHLCTVLTVALLAPAAPALAHHHTMAAGATERKAAPAVSTTEKNKALTRAFVEAVFNGRNVAAVDTYVAPTFVDHSPWPGQTGDVQGLKAGWAAHVQMAPDTRAVINDLIAEGDRVFMRATFTGSAAGKGGSQKFEMDSYDVLRFQNGKIVEHWGAMDMAGPGHGGHQHGEHDGHQH